MMEYAVPSMEINTPVGLMLVMSAFDPMRTLTE